MRFQRYCTELLEKQTIKFLYTDYTQGAVVCCKFYLTLLESQSPKIIHMCCTHLARLVANGNFLRGSPSYLLPIINFYLKTERLRPLVLELDLIKRLSTLLFQMGIDEKLQLLIVDTFCVLTEISNYVLCSFDKSKN